MLIQIGQAIGVLPTIALLIADSVLGAALMRSQGRAAWLRFNAALAEGRVPGREVMDGALVIFGGALLLTPGFLSATSSACCCCSPPTRAVIRGVLVKRFAGRIAANAASGAQARMFAFGTRPAARPAPGRRRRRRRPARRRSTRAARSCLEPRARRGPPAPAAVARPRLSRRDDVRLRRPGGQALRPRAHQPRRAGRQAAWRCCTPATSRSRRPPGGGAARRRAAAWESVQRGRRARRESLEPLQAWTSPTRATAARFDLRFEAVLGARRARRRRPGRARRRHAGLRAAVPRDRQRHARRAHAPGALPGPARAAVGQAGLEPHRARAQRLGVARRRPRADAHRGPPGEGQGPPRRGASAASCSKTASRCTSPIRACRRPMTPTSASAAPASSCT